MKQSYILWIVVIVVVAMLGGYFYLNRGSSKNSTLNSPVTQNIVTNKISIANFSFLPQNITVKAGDTVTWTNNDSTTHHIEADNGSFDLGDVPSGSVSTFVFENAGTFPYHCTIHPSMTGTVTVSAK